MKNLMKALLKAQKEMGAATKGANNPYFKSKYADYGSVLEAVKDPLNDNGIVVLQPHVIQDGKHYVKTVLVHAESGEEYSSMTPVVCAKENNPQDLGSAITYARRYGLQSLPCLPTEDDDGNAASGKTTASTKAPTQLTKLAEMKKEELKTVNSVKNEAPKAPVQTSGLTVAGNAVNTLAQVQKSMAAAQKAANAAPAENPVKKQTSWS